MNADLQRVWDLMKAGGAQIPPNPTIEFMREFANGANARQPLPQGVTFTDVDENGVKGIWSQHEGVSKTRAILYFHGGGYIVGTASSWRGLWGELGRRANMRVFGVEYRLAPENPFPAAHDDGLAAYRYLLKQGLAPGSIAFAGDSAGGAMAVATMYMARAAGLPMPGAGYLIAPWMDHQLTGATIKTKADVELLAGPDTLRGMSDAYLRGHSKSDPLVSPLYGDVTGLPPLMIQVGSEETLLDDSVRFAGKAGAAKAKVALEIYPDCFHVFQSWHSMIAEAREALDHAAVFLNAHLG